MQVKEEHQLLLMQWRGLSVDHNTHLPQLLETMFEVRRLLKLHLIYKTCKFLIKIFDFILYFKHLELNDFDYLYTLH